MSDPKRQLAYYGAFVESVLGLEVRVTEDERALVFADEGLVFAIHNTAAFDPGLVDLTVCVHSDEDDELKTEACRAVVQDVPCLRAWLDDDGDIILNAQSVAAAAHLLPRPEALREVVPRLLGLLRYAAGRVGQDATLAGIARASR